MLLLRGMGKLLKNRIIEKVDKYHDFIFKNSQQRRSDKTSLLPLI